MKSVFSNEEIPGRIHALQPFESSGKLPDGTRRWSGRNIPARDMGHLPPEYHESVRSAVYVVYSYETPVGWVTEDGEGSEPYTYHVPDVSYSPTTGTHQSACLDAWFTQMKKQGNARRFPQSGRQVVEVPSMADTYGGGGPRGRRPRAGGVDSRY